MTTQIEVTEYLPDDTDRRMLRPFISFRKSGAITLNKAACTGIGLSEGDKIILCQDKERPQDWYLKKHPDGVLLRHSKLGIHATNWKYIALKIFESIDFYGTQLRVPIVCDPTEQGLYAIITHNAQQPKTSYGPQDQGMDDHR